MFTSDPLHLIVQMRQRELLQIAERERLVRAAPKNLSNRRSPGLRIIGWIRGRLAKISTSEQNTCEKKPSTNLSCSVTKIQTR
jgi:hypothetical protein